MTLGKLQMMAFAAFAAVVTAGTIAYVFVEHPAYLRANADGVPYFTPPVINPVDGKPVRMEVLVRHYEGKDAR